ncbi:hypothetical protein SPOG_01891 [Schizosaccharomyces cryophilus OY26]|uniref:Uncharacterized protein n=1 Tax=Schizosaccharomyces cryophilus (strain OY26 / ATCC MYA-4695 / CBS 11777 / NBRC 106824 / NRRL Y48691) TaxID=653667 RepID=S9XG00_SCHCR|nr:uncharacterized protein SPOG_01891 [Schizosaccharomyces cryophilus OY26]EPY52571.1 hypothetical protein SPOG_01891 [Schizosaccharomyces cryophilus OY26]
MDSDKNNSASCSSKNSEAIAKSKASLKKAAEDPNPPTIHGPGGVPLSNPPRPFSQGGRANFDSIRLPDHIDIVKPEEQEENKG